MTHHGENTGSFDNDDITGREGQFGPDADRTPENSHTSDSLRTPVTGHTPDAAPQVTAPTDADVLTGQLDTHQVTLRTPAELADALPYLLGYRPEDSVVLVALHDWGGRGRFGGRARLGIPANPDDWKAVARELTRGLVTGSARRRGRPERTVAYLCQEPGVGETGRQVMERLQPLAAELEKQCSSAGAPIVEALCISGGRFWSYCCDKGCCPAEGEPMGLPGTSVLAAAATYAGIQVRGSLRELRARLLPWETAAALAQEVALDAAGMALVPRILDGTGRAEVRDETIALAERLIGRLAAAPPVTGALPQDLRDDELIAHDEAAALILGLQDRITRDRAAEWMEGDEAGPALRLWRSLARRCVGPYGEHAAAPLTLAGWVAWSTGDELEAREALAMALGADTDYLFARLLHQAINEGLDPESVRRCLRAERDDRATGTGEDQPVTQAPGDARHGDHPVSPDDSASPLTPPTAPPVRRRGLTRALPSGRRSTRDTAKRASRSRRTTAGTHPGAGRIGGTRPRSADGPARRRVNCAEDPQPGTGPGPGTGATGSGGTQEDT
ncbi:DUF4192 domain-containing protein [Streptomyces sp. JB150]|uniref:DUF4192 domain-containing protein n=1 Tax=Streptomyces sp. JB150 TaxID=2714844 RepID=UPI00140A2F91|nr:DUF4192 domain-containing protein [Streptomyces sp. JB150]QIJ65144.1 DUF4192 domain-containing protein [Streptomyces sp. JB150]